MLCYIIIMIVIVYYFCFCYCYDGYCRYVMSCHALLMICFTLSKVVFCICLSLVSFRNPPRTHLLRTVSLYLSLFLYLFLFIFIDISPSFLCFLFPFFICQVLRRFFSYALSFEFVVCVVISHFVLQLGYRKRYTQSCRDFFWFLSFFVCFFFT